LSATVVGMLRTRLELIAIELAEEKARLFSMVLLGLAALLCLALGLVVFSFLVVVLFWDTDYRYASIVVVGLAYLVAGAIMLLMVRKKANLSSIAFDDTLAELERDRQMLEAVADATRRRSERS
jgi:uncharacterized membrane protein YqjE